MIVLTTEQVEKLVTAYQDVVAKELRGEPMTVGEFSMLDEFMQLREAEFAYQQILYKILERIEQQKG